MQGTLTYIERLNNTVNGNPRFLVVIAPDALDKGDIQGTTKSDAGFTYGMPTKIGAPVNFRYHITKGGKIVFDNIEKV